jgi:hypothetical protein
VLDISGGSVVVAKESEIKGRAACSYGGGGLCGGAGNLPPKVISRQACFPTKEAAAASWCGELRGKTLVNKMQIAGDSVAPVYGGKYWIGLAPECPSAPATASTPRPYRIVAPPAPTPAPVVQPPVSSAPARILIVTRTPPTGMTRSRVNGAMPQAGTHSKPHINVVDPRSSTHTSRSTTTTTGSHTTHSSLKPRVTTNTGRVHNATTIRRVSPRMANASAAHGRSFRRR